MSTKSFNIIFVMLHSLIAFLLFTTLLNIAGAEPPTYKNECEVWDQYFCQFVGKDAYYKSDKKKTVIGKIIAVTLLEKGELFEKNPPIKAPEDAFYYVIDSGDEKIGIFLISTKVAKPVK